MKLSSVRTYKEYSDSSDEETEIRPQRPQQDLVDEGVICSMDRESLLELLLGTRRQIKHYISLNSKLQEQLNQVTKLYEQSLEKNLEFRETQKEIKIKEVRKLSSRRDKQNISWVGNSDRLKVLNHNQEQSSFRQRVLEMTHSKSEQQCLERIRSLKQSGKFTCSLYKMIDTQTQGECFKSPYKLSDAWRFITQLLESRAESQRNIVIVGRVQELMDCEADKIIQNVLKQGRQVKNLKELIELVQKKDSSILTSIYLGAKRSTQPE